MEFIKGAVILTCTKSNHNHYLIFEFWIVNNNNNNK